MSYIKATLEGEVVTGSDNEQCYPICPGCGQEHDPDTCHCGIPMSEHGYSDNHSPMPMGCSCYRNGAEKASGFIIDGE